MSKLGYKKKCQKVGKHLRISWVGYLCSEKSGTLKKPAQNASQCAWVLNVMHPAYLAKYVCVVFVQTLCCASQDSSKLEFPTREAILSLLQGHQWRRLLWTFPSMCCICDTFPGILSLFCLLSLAGSWQGLWRLLCSLGCRATTNHGR